MQTELDPRDATRGTERHPSGATGHPDLGMRFITRRRDGDFWYVQIRVMVKGRRHQLPGRSFYDRNYGGRENALTAAVCYRDAHAVPFFTSVGYSLPKPRPARPAHIPKFRKRREAKSGPMANLHYIHLYKKDGKYNRAVLDITVSIGGRSYHSTSYSYDFAKYGGKERALRIAKDDRNRLAARVHQKAMELARTNGNLPNTVHGMIKAVRIDQTPPLVEADVDRFLKRGAGNDFWIVAVRKKLWGRYYRAPNRRFYDADFGGKHRSRLEARRYAGVLDAALSREFDRLRRNRIVDRNQIRKAIRSAVAGAAFHLSPDRYPKNAHA